MQEIYTRKIKRMIQHYTKTTKLCFMRKTGKTFLKNGLENVWHWMQLSNKYIVMYHLHIYSLIHFQTYCVSSKLRKLDIQYCLLQCIPKLLNFADHKCSSVSIKSDSNYRPENCGFLFCCSTENQTDQLTIRYIFWQSRSIQGNH